MLPAGLTENIRQQVLFQLLVSEKLSVELIDWGNRVHHCPQFPGLGSTTTEVALYLLNKLTV